MTWIYEVFVEIEKTAWWQVKIMLWWPCQVQPKRSMNLSADWIQARCSAYNHACFSNHCQTQGHNHNSLEDIKAQMAKNPALTLNPWLSTLFGEARCAANAPQPLHWVKPSKLVQVMQGHQLFMLNLSFQMVVSSHPSYFHRCPVPHIAHPPLYVSQMALPSHPHTTASLYLCINLIVTHLILHIDI